jgi:hypothetical protein
VHFKKEASAIRRSVKRRRGGHELFLSGTRDFCHHSADRILSDHQYPEKISEENNTVTILSTAQTHFE